jgi:hypothetical protein
MNRKLSASRGLFALLLVNILIVARIFRVEFTPFMWSLEGSYIGLARWLTVNWTHPGWFPLWYGGIPVENAYPPLIHFLVALTSLATGMTIPHTWRAVTAAFYCLGPLAVFALVRRLTQSEWKALISGLSYSLISPSAFLFSVLRQDVHGGWGALGVYGILALDEGPNVASIALLLAALTAMHAAFEHRLGWRTVLAVLLSVATALTNWLGAVSLCLGALAMLMSRNRDEHKQPAVAHLILIGALSYAVASPWIPPSDIAAVMKNAQEVSGSFRMGAWQYMYLAAWIAGAFALASILKKRTSVPEAGRFAFVLLFLMAVPPLGFELLKIYPLPQPNRYHQEMDAAFAILAGIAIGSMRPISRGNLARTALGAALACLAVAQGLHWRRQIREWLPPSDITRTIERAEALYLNAHFPGQRVFVTGTTRYWFNAFANNPQLGGGYDQGRTNSTIADVTFAIPYVRGNGADTVALLKAYGVRAIAVGGPNSRGVYKEYLDPGKFGGVVPEVWRDGDDAIYEIPGSGSLVHLVNRSDLITTTPFDRSAITRYVSALDASPTLRIEWNGPNHGQIQANLAVPQVLSVQISFDRGWRASANGVAFPPTRDALGFLVLDPDCHGPCTIDLVYDGGMQGRLMRLLCVLGFTACGWIIFDEIRSKKHAMRQGHAVPHATA